MSVDITFDDEVQTLFLLSSVPKSWDGTITTICSYSENTKLTFKGIRELVFDEEIYGKNSRESSGSLLNADDREKTKRRYNSRGRSKYMKKSKSNRRLSVSKKCYMCLSNGRNQI